ncbi:hypothetical protein L7F22_043165 [Adiantum nelumboides]|nr:hypothetical protein [Adiantum nelumboides]
MGNAGLIMTLTTNSMQVILLLLLPVSALVNARAITSTKAVNAGARSQGIVNIDIGNASHRELLQERSLLMELRHATHDHPRLENASAEERTMAAVNGGLAFAHRRWSTSTSASNVNGDLQQQLDVQLYGPDTNPQADAVAIGPNFYYVQMGVGTPPVMNTFIIDTGSDLTWLQCDPCLACYNQAPIPVFDSAHSSSYLPTACPSTICSLAGGLGTGCSDAHSCTYKASYLDGSSSTGVVVQESFHWGPAHLINGWAFGCSHAALSFPNFGSGLLGLGAEPYSILSQLRTALFFSLPFLPTQILDTNSGATPPAGFIGLGHVPLPANRLITKLLNGKNHHSIPITAISVNGGVPIPIPPLSSDGSSGGAALDTGTSVTLLQPDIYASFRSAFQSAAAAAQFPAPSGGPRAFDTCYTLPDLSRSPTVTLHFEDGATFALPLRNTWVRLGNTLCLAFSAPSSFSMPPSMILGGLQMAGFLVTIDPPASTVIFAVI